MLELNCGDCREMLAALPGSSVDAVVTDPPYELTAARPGGRSDATRGKVMRGFMGMAWDGSGVAFDPTTWREVLRVLKPGGHLLAFGGSRTYHRLACAVEDAGFEIRDQIMWIYGQGFPKSKNLDGEWDGWGTALKPAHEPIVVARKPLRGTVAANMMTYGAGALNIDACRIPTGDKLGGGAERATTADQKGNDGWTRPWMDDASARAAHAERVRGNVVRAESLGRWPANVIHDGSDEVLYAFPDAPGQQGNLREQVHAVPQGNAFGQYGPKRAHVARSDSGSAARFFYCAKASRKERGPGNTHPTVKPVALMRYLVRLVTPRSGVVLDPFTGSGTTAVACAEEGLNFIGIEKEPEYVAFARNRLKSYQHEEVSVA